MSAVRSQELILNLCVLVFESLQCQDVSHCLLKNVHTGSGAHAALYWNKYRRSVPGLSWSGREVDDSRPSDAEFMNS